MTRKLEILREMKDDVNAQDTLQTSLPSLTAYRTGLSQLTLPRILAYVTIPTFRISCHYRGTQQIAYNRRYTRCCILKISEGVGGVGYPS